MANQIDNEIPKEIAEFSDRLGIEVIESLGMGDDGSAFLLTDGRVLRRSFSSPEVAVALALQATVASGSCHGAFPEVHGVWWVPGEIEINGETLETYNYVILRDEMPDVPGNTLFRSEERIWKNTLRCFDHGWREGKQDFIDAAIEQEPKLRRVYEALQWATNVLGIKVVDLGRISNFGMRNGQLGIRDFSRASVPAALLERVAKRDFPELPVGAQATFGGPSI